MDGKILKNLFSQQLLPNITHKSIIIMDNVSYHSVELNKVPTSTTLKADMQAWLVENNLECHLRAMKPVLGI